MSRIDARLEELGLALSPAMVVPGGMALPFPWVSVRGDRAIISGHGPQNPDGSLARPLGKVGADVTRSPAKSACRCSEACSASSATLIAARAGCGCSAC